MEDSLVYLHPALFQKFLKIQQVSVMHILMYCFLTAYYMIFIMQLQKKNQILLLLA